MQTDEKMNVRYNVLCDVRILNADKCRQLLDISCSYNLLPLLVVDASKKLFFSTVCVCVCADVVVVVVMNENINLARAVCNVHVMRLHFTDSVAVVAVFLLATYVTFAAVAGAAVVYPI